MIRWSKEPEMRAWVERMCTQYRDWELVPMLKKQFGLTVNANQIKGMRGRYKIHTGRSGDFEPGHKPWHAGTAGTGVFKATAGAFKKGQQPHNKRPVGSERVCAKDSIIKVKVRETGNYIRDWKSKHSVIWENHHGQKVPKGHVVMFADGDRRNFSIENLVLVHRRVNCMFNKRGYSNAPAEVRAALLSVAMLDNEINRKGKTP